LQDDRAALSRVVEKSLFLISFFIFPIVTGVIMFAPYLVEYIPEYQKWKPAVLALSFYSLNALVASVSVPLTNFLNAIGKIKTTLYFMIFLTVSTWVLTILLVYLYGYNGVAAASFVVAASGLSIVYFVKKHIQFSFIRQIYKQLIAAVFMAVVVFIAQPLITSLWMIFFIGLVSLGAYGIAMMILAKEELQQNVQFIIKSLRHK
jgi:O-antigen/teichoic acid export membrane protein